MIRTTDWRSALAHIAVWLVAGIAFLNGLVACIHPLAVRLRDFREIRAIVESFETVYWSRSVTVLIGLALIYLSVNLIQRKLVAWWLTLAATLTVLILNILHLRDALTLIMPSVMLGALFLFRRQFTVRSETTSIAHGLRLAVLVLLSSLAYGTVGFWMLEKRDFGIEFVLTDSLARTLREFALIGNEDIFAHTLHARWFLASLRLTGIAAAAIALYSLFRPVAYRTVKLPHERGIVRGLLATHGGSSLDYFKLWSDKSYFFGKNQESVIAYRAAWGVAISLGDPIGPAETVRETVESFRLFCVNNGWDIAFHQVGVRYREIYELLGFDVLYIGDNAIVDLESFRSRCDKEDFGRAHRKLTREGYMLHRALPPHPNALLDAVSAVSDEWLTVPGRRERGFTVGQFSREYMSESALDVVRNADGDCIAFANEIPSFSKGEVTIDLMRHRVNIPNGTMDFLFRELFIQLREEGYIRFDLGLAPFTAEGKESSASFEEQALRQMYEHLNRFFSFKGLRNYKAKFEPEWSPRYLVYRGGTAGLLKASIALTRMTEEEMA